jgi:hypothetical protein
MPAGFKVPSPHLQVTQQLLYKKQQRDSMGLRNEGGRMGEGFYLLYLLCMLPSPVSLTFLQQATSKEKQILEDNQRWWLVPKTIHVLHHLLHYVSSHIEFNPLHCVPLACRPIKLS